MASGCILKKYIKKMHMQFSIPKSNYIPWYRNVLTDFVQGNSEQDISTNTRWLI